MVESDRAPFPGLKKWVTCGVFGCSYHHRHLGREIEHWSHLQAQLSLELNSQRQLSFQEIASTNEKIT